MKCPTDGTQLVISERSGIEIDYCTDCRGIWLNRGELDKIIDRSTGPIGGHKDYHDGGRSDTRRDGQQPARRRSGPESWLGDLFG
ncbi:TFIIB-type zinc ribbon-containing protein [Luethyella okanaganae]|uniref:Zf-TFIIB domain-containing protein n=1 Tax=Luethyella okanaganae TaxID=69372 RepID=A0ABW1VEL1_9MICO